MGNWPIYLGALVLLIWGIWHIVPTRTIVTGFGELTADNRRIITMEWVAEGMAHAFIGVLVLAVAIAAAPGDAIAILVLHLAAAMEVVIAAWTALTGFAIAHPAFKACPFVLTAAAAAIWAGTLI